jgi:hypothetical protein
VIEVGRNKKEVKKKQEQIKINKKIRGKEPAVLF